MAKGWFITSWNMSSITAIEAGARFGEILDRVVRGEEVVITRHDKPVARLVPEGQGNRVEVRAAVAGLRQLRESIRARKKGRAKLTDAEVRAAVDEGRS